MTRRSDFDLIVIGSGAGGGVAAHYAASLGKKVLVVEKGEMGGECPNIGCVPTKALLQAAETYETIMAAGEFGINIKDVTVNYSRVKGWKDLVVARTGTSEGEEAFKAAGIHILRDEAEFTGPHQIKVGHHFYTAKRFIIATGSTNAVPPIPGLKEAGYISFKEAIDLTKPPKSLFIIGGGPIGCEFAQIFSTFGTKITIADAMPRLLGREDKDAGELLAAIFAERGINVITGSEIIAIEHTSKKKIVHYKLHGRNHTIAVEEILVATGKKPNVHIGLEEAGVKYDRHGVIVNKYLQTSARHIYAAGDIVGPYLFTHTATYQGNIASHNAFANKKVPANYDCVPRCTYTKPEVASVGLSEIDALDKKIDYKVGAAPLSIIGRANTSNEGVGFAKIISDKRGRVIGGVVVSPRAGELIHEVALAIQLKATASDLASTIHAFPTFSELIRFAARAVK